MTPQAETSHNRTQSFVEIFLNDQNSACPDFTDVYVCEIKSSLCRTFVDELSGFLSSSVLEDEMIKYTSESLDFPSLTHLRRVRRRTLAIHGCKQAQTTSDDTFTSSTDRLASLKSNNNTTVVKLEVLLTSVKYLDYLLSVSDKTREKWNHIVSKYNLSVVKRIVPGRSAKSQEEMNEWKRRQNDLEDDAVDGPIEYKRTSWWPTLFFPEKTDEYMLRKLELTFEDINYMRDGMMEAINDSKQHKAMSSHYIPGAVVMSPSSKIVIASSFQERKLQTQTLRSLDHGIDMDLLQVNPLCTPILLAIQGVSRRERCTIAEANVNTDDPTGQVRITLMVVSAVL